MRNVVIAQSGGPTSVINASLLGVLTECQAHRAHFGHIYAAKHGIEGLLREELLDLNAQDRDELQLLRTTPAAGAIGTCRYKVKPDQEEDMERIVAVLGAHDIGAFFYIGGNDSMDTAHRINVLAEKRGLDLICVGIPKTIDNDLGDQERQLIDHTPGYGSVARYWANLVLTLNEENRGSCPADPVMVVQAMGRRIGFIPAAARLADPDRNLPLQIYLPEAGHTLESLAANVEQEVRKSGRALVVVSEGFDVGTIGERYDSFGHVEFGASQQSVAQVVVNYLNHKGLPVRGSARGQVPGTEQRHAIHLASPVDIDEAFNVGRHAAKIAMQNETGFMATIKRANQSSYAVTYGRALLTEMANSERVFPKEWIAESGIDVTDAFIEYARPLIGESALEVPLENGLPRFARLVETLATRQCAEYIPQTYRKG
jgi:ATP-dependent phosphofructokinase / diphosphate-dependent phosphofructokinase